MRKLALLLIFGLAGFLCYQYFVNGADPLAGLFQSVSGGLPKKDAEGRELVPCQRCLATGQITCSASRCKDGQVPCPGRCLKLSDRGWRRMDGQDPDKLFMVYPVNGGTQGVSQAHVGEVFEVRLGKFYNLGVCKICAKRTTVPCKVCAATGKVVCTVCQGAKVVPKNATPAPAAANKPPPRAAAETPEPPGPRTFRLKNGKSVTGTLIIRDHQITWIRAEDGRRVELKNSEIASER